MVYRFEDPEKYHGIDPQPVGEALAALRTDGEIDAVRVVEAAAESSSPLHPLFEWDDTRAAKKYRLLTARMLIRNVVVAPADVEDERTTTARAVPVRTVTRTAVVDVAPETPLTRAQEALLTWRRKYGHLPQFAEVVAAIDAALEVERRPRRLAS